MVVVVLDSDFDLITTLKVPRVVIEELFPIRPYVNGRIITFTNALASHPKVSVIDMTAAYGRIGAASSANGTAGATDVLDPDASH